MKIWKDMQQIVTRYENIYQRNSQNHLNSRLYLINWNLCPELLHIFQNINLRMFLNLGILSWGKYFRNKSEEMICDGWIDITLFSLHFLINLVQKTLTTKYHTLKKSNGQTDKCWKKIVWKYEPGRKRMISWPYLQGSWKLCLVHN